MVVSDDVADALVLKLKAAGFDIDLETATCADLMLALDACKIQNPRRFTAGSPRISSNGRTVECILTTVDPLVSATLSSSSREALLRIAGFMVDACNRYLP